MKIFKKEPNFSFMSKRGYAFLLSGIIIAVGVFLFYSQGFNLGVDFTGGTNIEISFRQDISENQIRNALEAVGLGKSKIQRVGQENKFFIKATMVEGTDPGTEDNTGQDQSKEEGAGISSLIEEALKTPEEKENSAAKLDLNSASQQEITGWLVSKGVNRATAEETAVQLSELRTDNTTGLINDFREIEQLELKSQALRVLKEHTYLGEFTFLSGEMVGPEVGHNMRQKVTLATVWAMLGMLIYIAFRFRKIVFGVAAVITLLHDVLVSLTFILLFQVEVSLSVVAGILTIVGYSLNDTIVIFDRVRDNLKSMKRQNSEIILDRSINQTLSRTLVTSGTTLLVVLSLFFFGGEVIHAFSFTLLVGVAIGTYSSIFQSCVWLRIWEHWFLGTKKK